MNADFCEEQKQKLLIQRKEILESLAGRSEQLSNMVDTLETGDDAVCDLYPEDSTCGAAICLAAVCVRETWECHGVYR